MDTSVARERESPKNVKEFFKMSRHVMLSNRTMIHIATLMQTLKMECDVREMSQSIIIGS